MSPKSNEISSTAAPPAGPNSARLYAHARKDIGVKERPGPGSDPRILQALKTGPDWLDQDDGKTAWCGLMMGLWCQELQLPRPLEHYRAANWLAVGTPVELQNAVRGDIVVLSRRGGNHVGLYHRHTATSITLLGGNQSNAVNLTGFPISSLKGIRRV